LTTRTKRRLLFAWLVAFAIWPLAHRGLVARYEISPWKLFGWSMYCEPNLPPAISLQEVRRDGFRYPIDIRALPPEMQQRLDQFQRRRDVLGQLASPRVVADAVFDINPNFEGIAVVIQRYYIDTDSGRLGSKMRRYVYWRSER
jgi:hypothetical protein